MKEAYIRHLGYKLKTMWECQWKGYCANNANVISFSKDLKAAILGEKTSGTEEDILNRIESVELFGLIECDIHVPENLKEKFEEMSPIFKNVMVSREDISDHMREFVKDTDHLKTPKRMLIGSMFGEKILLFTELVKWYLDQGLKVTKIYSIFSYKRAAIFRRFGESVSDARRQGDADPDKALMADMAKLIGNSVYGKTITNKEKHRDVKYVIGKQQASAKVKSARFLSLDELGNDLYEIESRKYSINMDIPVVIGFVILQYAKLRMLQFYYDFLDT